MLTLILALAFVVGITVAYLIGRADGADAEYLRWRRSLLRYKDSIEQQCPTTEQP
ncbi:MAG: hypothetical protein INR66_21190 [Gordonia polyisoprenivorans]|nr:hypothetical protein [Gordonia polyisoprenivorans]